MVGKEAVPQHEAYIDAQQGDAECCSDVFRGIKAGVTIALILFWIPFLLIYLMFGWWHVVIYCVVLMMATAVTGLLLNVGCALKAPVREETPSTPLVSRG